MEVPVGHSLAGVAAGGAGGPVGGGKSSGAEERTPQSLSGFVPLGRSANCITPLPSAAFIVKICSPEATRLRLLNAIIDPSGENAGSRSTLGEVVRRVCAPPFASMLYTSVLLRFSPSGTRLRPLVKAIFDPSGA
jgi:hypothetical protein